MNNKVWVDNDDEKVASYLEPVSNILKDENPPKRQEIEKIFNEFICR